MFFHLRGSFGVGKQIFHGVYLESRVWRVVGTIERIYIWSSLAFLLKAFETKNKELYLRAESGCLGDMIGIETSYEEERDLDQKSGYLHPITQSLT